MAFKDLYLRKSVRVGILHYMTEPLNLSGAIYVCKDGDIYLEDWRIGPVQRVGSFPSVEEAYAAGVMMGIWNE